MAGTWEVISQYHHFLYTELSDPRTIHWPLISTPWPGLTLIALYVYFCKSLGPRLMEDRKPFQLKGVMRLYNLAQIAVNAYILYLCVTLGWFTDYNWLCQPVDPSYTPRALKTAYGIYLFMWVKIFDLLDTVFFVLRKKNNQVTFLHLYHHAGMVALAWGCTKYYPGGHDTFIGLVNSFVHMIMYSYYFLSSFGSGTSKYLWWKKHLTQLQMFQLLAIILHSVALLVHPYCGYPRVSAFVLIPQNAFMLVLFYDFYRKTYGKKTR